jgi:anti-sigma factor RsiW
MTCKEYAKRLDLFEDYVDGVLEAAAAATVTAHLARCSACREAVESARLAAPLLRAGLEPTPEPDEIFWTRMRAHLREEEGRERVQEFWPAMEWLARRLTLTSAVALVVLFAFLFATEPKEPAITASGQTDIREIFPESVRQPANQNEVLVSLASNGNGR